MKTSVRNPAWLTKQLFMPKSNKWWSQKEIAGKVRAAPGGRGKQADYSRNKLKPSSLRKGNKVSVPPTMQSMAQRSHMTENTRTRLRTVLKTEDVGSWPSFTVSHAPLKFTLTLAP